MAEATAVKGRMDERRRSRDPWPPNRPGVAAWWRDHLRISRETVHFVSARLGTSLLVWLLVGIALALPAGLFLVQENLAEMTAAWDGRPGLTAYFDLDADPGACRCRRDQADRRRSNRKRAGHGSSLGAGGIPPVHESCRRAGPAGQQSAAGIPESDAVSRHRAGRSDGSDNPGRGV